MYVCMYMLLSNTKMINLPVNISVHTLSVSSAVRSCLSISFVSSCLVLAFCFCSCSTGVFVILAPPPPRIRSDGTTGKRTEDTLERHTKKNSAITKAILVVMFSRAYFVTYYLLHFVISISLHLRLLMSVYISEYNYFLTTYYYFY